MVFYIRQYMGCVSRLPLIELSPNLPVDFQPQLAQFNRRISLVCLETRAGGDGDTSGRVWFSTINECRSVHQERVEGILVVDGGEA